MSDVIFFIYVLKPFIGWYSIEYSEASNMYGVQNI